MFRRLPTWIKWTLAITMGIVLCVAALVLLFYIFVLVSDAIYRMTPSYQVEKGVVINTFSPEDRDIIADSFGISCDDTITFSELQYSSWFRGSYIVLFAQTALENKETADKLLLDRYVKVEDGPREEPFFDSFLSGMNPNEYVGEYTYQKQGLIPWVYVFEKADSVVYVFYADRGSKAIHEYARRQVEEGNYKKLHE